MAIDYKSIGRRIKQYRTNKKFSQDALGQIVFVNNEHISRIEAGTKGPVYTREQSPRKPEDIALQLLAGTRNSHRTALDLEVTPSAEPNMSIYEIAVALYLVV